MATNKILVALKIKNEERNYSFIEGKKIISDQVIIDPINILFKKID